MGLAEGIIILVILGGALVIPLGIVHYATRAPDRAWKVFGQRTGLHVESSWGKFTISGELRGVPVLIKARRMPGFFQMNATMEGTASLPGPFPPQDERIESALAAIQNITTDFEISGGEFRWKMVGTPAHISKVPVLLERIARIADVLREPQS